MGKSMKNTGLILSTKPKVKDWKFLGYTGIDDKILRDDGQWDNYLPVYEKQSRPGFDSYACVTFATLNCVETLIRRQWGREENYSDRFLATASETTCGVGNWMYKVAETLRIQGCCLEELYPFSDDINTCTEFYSPIPESISTAAKRFSDKYLFRWEWVSPTFSQEQEKLKTALQYSPVTVVVNNGRHLVELYGYEDGQYWKTYDHYDYQHRIYPWDYVFGPIMKFSLNNKFMPELQIPNDTLVQEIEESGTFGLALDNKIIVDDPALLTLTWMMRNKGNTDGKTQVLDRDEWDSFDKINLSKQPI